jgi:glycosyltransferase involved in cell wall biosynthesis
MFPAPRRPNARDGVSLVIPAHNEAEHIAAIARIALRAALVNRVIVVDDGSIDGTAEAASAADPGLEVLRTTVNQGKAAALLLGIQAAGTDLIAFLDADLIGLNPQHIDDLIRPVLAGECDMTLGLFRGGRLHTDLAHRTTPYLSGQRCLRWGLFRDTPLLQGARYGVEVALSLHAHRRGLRVQAVTWNGVTHVTQPEKHGAVRGVLSYLRMYAEILIYLVRLGLEPLARRGLLPAWSARIGRGH